jgi:hypothetical protein
MNKQITILSVIFILMISMVSAVYSDEEYNKLKQENLKLKNAFMFYVQNSIYVQNGYKYIAIPIEMNFLDYCPIRHSGSSSSSSSCDECEPKPVCVPYYKRYVDDGKDSCGCAINPRCVDNNVAIKPIARLE